MKSIVRIATEGSCQQSCGMVRAVMPAYILNQSDFWNVAVKPISEFNMSDWVGTNVVIFQRVFDASLIPIVQELRKQGTRIVFDIDDALWLLPSQQSDPAFKQFSLTFTQREALFEFMTRHVDLTIASTCELETALHREAPKLLTTVVGNTALPQFFNPAPRAEKQTFDVCWYAAQGHNHQAEFIGEVFEKFLSSDGNENNRVHIVGPAARFPKLRNLVDKYSNQIVLHSWIDYTKLGAFLNTMDCVVCPIIPHPFTICKSEIKAVESTMTNTPVLMSDVPQYRRFAYNVLTQREMDFALLPNNADMWVSHLLTHKYSPMPSLKNLHQRTNRVYGMTSMIQQWTALLKQVLVDEVFYSQPFEV